MLSGCAAKTPGVADSLGYTDQNPDMVFATLKSGDIPYEGYRLLIDVNELADRQMARRELALSAALTKDLDELDVFIDELSFRIDASSDIMQNYLTGDTEEFLQQVAQASGLTQEQIFSAMLEIYRPQYLMSLMLDFRREQALNSLSEDTADMEGEASKLAAEVLGAYYESIDSRFEFDDDTLLVVLDGEPVELGDNHREFIDYVAAVYRMELLTRLQVGEAMRRELDAKGKAIDMDEFNNNCELQINAALEDAAHMSDIDGYLAAFGATREQYFESYRKLLLGEFAGAGFADMIAEEYSLLASDSPQREGGEYSYFNVRINEVLEDARLVNISGKTKE